MEELLTRPHESSPYWSMTEGVFNCLIDSKRTSAFARAIKKTVVPGDVVVDMGTGSGVLAMLAARAGAKVVFAVEHDPNNIRYLHDTIALNGYGGIVQIINGSILDVILPEKVDVVIGELIATALIEELQIMAMNHILNFAKPNARILLQRYDTFLDVVHNRNRYSGLRFDIPRYEYPDDEHLKSTQLSKKILLQSYDFTNPTKDLRVSHAGIHRITKAGRANGLRLSGVTTFCDGSKLSATFAYSYPLILPIPEIRVEPGCALNIELNYVAGMGMRNVNYSVRQLK